MKEYRFSDLQEGLTESFTVVLTRENVDKFTEITGDINPLHIDEDYAKSKGFNDIVVYGLLTSSYYSTLAGVYLPGKFCILQGVDIQFSKPVFVGDELTVTGKISYLNEAYKQAEIKAVITNQDGKKVSKATIKAGVLDE